MVETVTLIAASSADLGFLIAGGNIDIQAPQGGGYITVKSGPADETNSGAATFKSADALTSFNSGAVTVNAGSVVSGVIGKLTLGGSSADDGTGGAIDIIGGFNNNCDGASVKLVGCAAADGGKLTLQGGASYTTGQGGHVEVFAGNSSGAAGGNVTIKGGSGTGAGGGDVILIANDGGMVIMTGLPSADPEIAGAVYTSGVVSAGVPRALWISGGPA